MDILTATNKQQLFIYSGNSNLGLQGLGYIRNTNFNIRTININKDTLNDIIWLKIAASLGLELDELFSKEHLPSELAGESHFLVKDSLDLLRQYPNILQQPIAINGVVAQQIVDITQLLGFFGSGTTIAKEENQVS